MNNKDKYLYFYYHNNLSIPVISSPWWLDAVCGIDNWDVIIYEEKGVIKGYYPYYKTRLKRFYAIIQPPFTQYLGPIIIYPDGIDETKRLEYEKKVISNLIDKFDPKVDVIINNTSPNLKNWLPFYWKGYNQTSRYTYTTNNLLGKSESDLLAGYTKNARKTINKFFDEGYTYAEANEIGFSPKEFYNLHAECLKKINRNISYDQFLLHRMVESAYNENSGKVLVALNKNDLICGATFFIYNTLGSIGINTAADHSIPGLGYYLNHLCILESSKLVDSYNIGGSMNEGVEKVYRQLGLKQTEYFQVSKECSKNYRIFKAFRRLGSAIIH